MDGVGGAATAEQERLDAKQIRLITEARRTSVFIGPLVRPRELLVPGRCINRESPLRMRLCFIAKKKTHFTFLFWSRTHH